MGKKTDSKNLMMRELAKEDADRSENYIRMYRRFIVHHGSREHVDKFDALCQQNDDAGITQLLIQVRNHAGMND